MKCIITVGISGSGKSTWAELNAKIRNELSPTPCVVINRDSTRWKLSGKQGWNGPNAYKFHSAVEDEVTELNAAVMINAAHDKKDIIIADTNLNPKTRNKLIAQCEALGYEVEIKEFPISFQEACKRDATRGIYSVGEAVLMKQWESWVTYWQDKGDGMWDTQRSKDE